MRTVTGLLLTLIVAAVSWFLIGRPLLDKVNESNARSGGGGPQSERVVNAAQFAPIVRKLYDQVRKEFRLAVVTVRPDSVEFEVVKDGRARGYRWRRGVDRLETYEVGGTGQAGQPSNAPYSAALLDTAAPGRIAAQISKAEHGDFHNSISDLQRADSGKVVWVMRGTIGERGVAYYATPNGRSIKPYDPSSPELSKGAALGHCIQGAHGNPARLQRCLAKFGP